MRPRLSLPGGRRGESTLPALLEGAAESLPGVARIATAAALRSALWGVESGARSGQLLARTLTEAGSANDLVQSLASDMSEATRVVSDVARAVANGVPVSQAVMDAGASLHAAVLAGDRVAPPPEPVERSLRERGEDLLHRSRDVWADDEAHPAYGRILDELAPDEARLLLLLLREGPQPSVDVRTGGPVGMVSSQLIAPGLNMMGARAGVRHTDEVPAYLNNLFRLGLLWFSREQVRDPVEYQVVEAQPDVVSALRTVRFARVVRRSIHLTPFGVDFATTCLIDPEHVPDLPGHEDPDSSRPDF